MPRQALAVVAVVLTLTACGSSEPSSPGSTSPPTPSPAALPRIELPVAQGSTVEGLVDVDGHDIYARCSGSGSPTVVYFTGWAPDPSKRAVQVVRGIEEYANGKLRICSYERRNTGRSEAVPGTQSPADIVADVDGVLDALDEDGPFLLLGASFGGLVAGAYAVAHPERVAGILLLDAGIPDDYAIEVRHGFDRMCLAANRHTDAFDTLENIDNCRLAKWAYDRRDREPPVPLTYLAAGQDPERTIGDDDLRQAFVRRWSPGVWEVVNTPHWIDEADPLLVVEHLRELRKAILGG